MKCHEFYDSMFITEQTQKNGVPKCSKCGGIVKPDVVLYEEGLDQACINGAVNAISEADMLIIGGTSLTVYPAAGLVNYFRGNKIVIINKTATGNESGATLVFHEPIGEVLGKIVVR